MFANSKPHCMHAHRDTSSSVAFHKKRRTREEIAKNPLFAIVGVLLFYGVFSIMLSSFRFTRNNAFFESMLLAALIDEMDACRSN